MINLLHGDCLEQMKTLDDNSVDSIVSDPPYGISFMAKKWDYDVPSVEVWNEAMRVLKPGGHALIACGTRTQHRMVVNIEDAGFEIRDVVSWIYGSGFPKSLNVSKAIDKRGGVVAEFEPFKIAVRDAMKLNNVKRKTIIAALGNSMLSHYLTDGDQPAIPNLRDYQIIRDCVGLGDIFDHLFIAEAEREVVGKDTKARSTSGKSALPTMGGDTVYQSWDITAPATESAKQWDGWGTALKPACEFFTLCRKPLSEKTIAANVLKWGTGGINIDGCRVEVGPEGLTKGGCKDKGKRSGFGYKDSGETPQHAQGRFPANLIHDGSQEVLELFPDSNGSGGKRTLKRSAKPQQEGWGMNKDGADEVSLPDAGKGSAARFFYCPKASKKDRDEGLEGFEEKESAGMAGNMVDGQRLAGDGTPIKTPIRKNNHPTVKPTALMAYLCRLITPTGGVVLDPYMGSGSTGKAAVQEGFSFVGCELDKDYFQIATARVTNGQDLEVRGDNF